MRSAVQARNEVWAAKLSSLIATHTRGAPSLKDATMTKSVASKQAQPTSTAKLIARFAFTSSDPKSVAQRISRLSAMNFAAGFAERSLFATPTEVPKFVSSAAAAAAPTAATPPAAPAAAAAAADGTSSSVVVVPTPEATTPPPAPPATFAEALHAIGGGEASPQEVIARFATASIFGGFTWLVVNNSTMKIEVLNTPAFVSPLTIGYTPLIAIDVTPEAVLMTPASTDANASPVITPIVPSWSRAARNPKVSFDRSVTLQAPWEMSPATQRQAAVARAVQHIDWAFAEQQYTRAIAWLTSDKRAKAKEARKSALAQAAVATVHHHRAATEVGEDAAFEHAASAAAATTASTEQQPASATTATTPATAATTETAAAVESAAETVEELKQAVAATEEAVAALATDPTPVPLDAGTPLPDGSIMFNLGGGATEYRKPDGTRVVVRADGSQAFYSDKNELFITVHADGTQEWPRRDNSDVLRTLHRPDGSYQYDYVNNVTVTVYPDGRSVTRFADGTVREVLPEAAAPGGAEQ